MENISQIGEWILNNVPKEEARIELYLKLTNKDVDALHDYPVPEAFAPKFSRFCLRYSELIDKYQEGSVNQRDWAGDLLSLSDFLKQNCHLV